MEFCLTLCYKTVSVSRGGDALSLPRTPVSCGPGSLMPGGARSLSLGSRSVGGGASVCGSAGGGGGGSAGGRTMRDYDEGLRDLKKENFNLKLRIYFLEERLGKVPGGGGGVGVDDRLVAETPTATGDRPRDSNSVMDLKVSGRTLQNGLPARPGKAPAGWQKHFRFKWRV